MNTIWWDILVALDGLFLAGVVWWSLRRPRPQQRPADLPSASPPPDLEIRFEAESSRLSPPAERALEEVAEGLRADPRWTLSVVGSADDTGHLTQNRRLSRGRAQAVLRFLAARGVASSRVTTAALEPARGTTEDEKARLRRATLTWETRV